MTSQELKLARLSKIFSSVLKQKDLSSHSHSEAYTRVLQNLENSIQEEKNFNREQLEIFKQTEEEERKREELKEAMQKHHFKLLQNQIADRAAQRASLSATRAWKAVNLNKEEGYVWKGMSREQWRNVLDGQIKEKKTMKDCKKQFEIDLDKERIEMAKKSLEEELKIKEIERKKRQGEMWESWEKTKEVTRLQKQLDKVRRYGENSAGRYGMTPGKRKNDYFDDILKGYENTFGKVELGYGRTTSKAGESIVASGRITRKRSKSSFGSIGSYNNAIVKLGNLIQEEEALKKQKQDLVKLLEKPRLAGKQENPINVQ